MVRFPDSGKFPCLRIPDPVFNLCRKFCEKTFPNFDFDHRFLLLRDNGSLF